MNDILQQQITTRFAIHFGSKPILVFSPGRINLIGEHTDYNNGFVFPAAIDKGIYLGISTSEVSQCEIVALNVNKTHQFSLNNIKVSVKKSWENYVLGVVFEIQKIKIIPKNFNIVFAGDIPIGSGLSSSAALENAVVYALNELFDLRLTKEQMIYISQHAEHNFVGVKCGIMDQYASMFGEKNSALLLDCKSMESKIFPIHFEGYSIVLINSNVSHNLAESAYNKRRDSCERVSKALNKTSLREVSLIELVTQKDLFSNDDFEKAYFVLEENNRVIKAAKAIKNNDLQLFGHLLYESHHGLSTYYKVSCEELDFLVNFTKGNSNSLGARMMGGGFGGCTINIIRNDALFTFSNQIKKLYYNNFNKECDVYTVKLYRGTHLI